MKLNWEEIIIQNSDTGLEEKNHLNSLIWVDKAYRLFKMIESN